MRLRDAREDRHGTRTNYVSGCRCEECRGANARYARDKWAGTAPPRAPFQHGKSSTYNKGCRCAECRQAKVAVVAAWRERNPEAYRNQISRAAPGRRAYKRAQWRGENREYLLERGRKWRARQQEISLAAAWRAGAAYEPHEDALLARIPSNVAAASALGRTVNSVRGRREKLRKKGLLQ